MQDLGCDQWSGNPALIPSVAALPLRASDLSDFLDFKVKWIDFHPKTNHNLYFTLGICNHKT